MDAETRSKELRTWRSRENGWQALRVSSARKLLNQALQGAVKLFPSAVSKGRGMAVSPGAFSSTLNVCDGDSDEDVASARRYRCIKTGDKGGGRLSTMRNSRAFHAKSWSIGTDASWCRSPSCWAVAVPSSRERDARNSVRDNSARGRSDRTGNGLLIYNRDNDARSLAGVVCCFWTAAPGTLSASVISLW